MALAINNTKEHEEDIQILKDMEEEEEELFEINLDIVNQIPPPHYWESYFTATSNTVLLANCLLPIADVASAVPMVSKAWNELSWSPTLSKVLVIAESVPGEFLGFPSMGDFGLQHKEMMARYLTE